MLDLNGAGVNTSEENALGVVLRIDAGSFSEVIAGDLPGDRPDVESVVGPEVGQVDVYHVNHHGSAYSSNNTWLNAIGAKVAVLSVGGNPYGHPTAAAVGRIHAHGLITYWTNAASGVLPDPVWDRVGGNIIVEVTAQNFSVTGIGFSDEYAN